MNKVAQNKKIEMPNLILIAGNGRNVGKTFLACKIIKKLAKEQSVTGLKISPHFHESEKSKAIFQSNDFVIIEETQITKKDSSLMLQAGAEKVYFVMAEQQNLQKAFLQLHAFLPDTAIVGESGGLTEFINPAIFLFVKNENEKIIKSHLLNYSPIIVENNGSSFNFNIEKIKYSNHRFSIE